MDALQQLNIAAPVADVFGKIEYDIIIAIARQLSKNPEQLINHTSEWRIQMLARMGKVDRDTARYIAKQTGGVPDEIESIINETINAVLEEHGLSGNDKVIENIGKALEAFDHQAVRDKYNQVNTVMQYKAKRAYVNGVNSVADKFEKNEIANKQEHLDILNKNALEVTLGEKSRTEAIRDTIREMSDKGIPAFVDASGREWSPEAYVNMDIRNTAKNAALMSEFECTKELGQDVILVSSHAAARPLCAPYQGKFYSLSGKAGTITDAYGKEYTYTPLSSTSYGEPAGLFGINCGHTFRGVEDGCFVNNEEQYDEKENSEEYDKVVKQRAMEREIRKNKMKRDALKAAGDEEGAKEYDRRVREGNKRLNEYCAENGLTVRNDRTQVYGYKDESRKEKPKEFVEIVEPKKPAFVPAGSIEEAESFAKSIGIRHVDYSDLPLETANLLNEAALTLPEDTRPAFLGSSKRLQEVAKRKFDRSAKTYYGVHLDAYDFTFGEYPNIEHDFDGGEAVGISSYYKTADKIEKAKIKGNAEYAKKYDGHTQFFNTDGRSTAFHEMGHVYADVKGIPEGFAQDAARWATESKCDMLKSTSEAWAEAWGAYHTKNPNLPDYIAKYVHERTNTPLERFANSTTRNYAKSIGAFNFYEVSDSSPVTAEGVISDLKKSKIGKLIYDMSDELPEGIRFVEAGSRTKDRGESIGNSIFIYVDNCNNNEVAAMTVIHECTHHFMGIGESLWAECVCYSQELKHLRNRDLTISEKKSIIKIVKEQYPEYNWRKGGKIGGRKRSH